MTLQVRVEGRGVALDLVQRERIVFSPQGLLSSTLRTRLHQRHTADVRDQSLLCVRV